MDFNKINIGIAANPIADDGKNTYLSNLLDLLVPLSNEIFVINGDFSANKNSKVHIINLMIKENKRKSIAHRSLRYLVIQAKYCHNIFKLKNKIDIFIFFNATMVLPMLLIKFLRKKSIVIMGGSVWRSTNKLYVGSLWGFGNYIIPLILRAIESIGLMIPDRIAVESKSAILSLGMDKYQNKIVVISNMYLDINKFKIINNINNRRNLIGFISRLEEGKGIRNFIDAIPLILKQRKDIEFLIGGDGLLANEIREKLENDQFLKGNVKLVGWIPHEKLPEYLNKLKVLVLPSYSEGLPNIITESMACGAIVLSTPVGGVPDIIIDKHTGFLIENNTPECISTTLLSIFNHPNLESITNNARKIIEDKHNYSVVVSKYRDAMKEVL